CGRPVGGVEDRLGTADGLPERCVAVSAVEALGRAERYVDAVEPTGPEALPAAFVQHEPRVLDAVAPVDCRDDLLRARHLGHTVVAHEAGALDAREPRNREPVDEVGANGGSERLRLVL